MRKLLITVLLAFVAIGFIDYSVHGQGQNFPPGGGASAGNCSTVGALAYYLTATTLGCDPGVTTNGSGQLTTTGGYVGVTDGVHPTDISGVGNTTAPTITANTFHITWPNTTTFTAYGWQVPGTNPSANNVIAIGSPDGTSKEAAITYLSNATTVNGQTCTLGATCATAGNTASSLAALTAQAANIAGTTLFTTPSTACSNSPISCRYVACANASITQAATSSSTLPNLELIYTDAVDSNQKFIFIANSQTANATFQPTGGCFPFYAKPSTVVQYQTQNYASSGVTPMQYDFTFWVTSQNANGQ